MNALATLFPDLEAHFEYISPRSDSPKPGFRVLNQELERKRAKLLQIQQFVGKLEEDNAHLEQQRVNLVACIRDVRRQTATVTQDLDVSRSFAPEEGTVKEEDVLADSRKLGRLTDSVVSHLVDLCPPDVRSRKITPSTPRMQDIGPFIDFLLQRNPDARMETVMIYGLHYKLRSYMMDAIFSPLVPGLSNENSDLFNSIYLSVKKNETQERSARWRAMTYSHLKPNLGRYEGVVFDAMGDISRFLSALLDSQIEIQALLDLSGQQMKELFESAHDFHTKTQTGCTSVNINTFLPVGSVFDATCMDALDGTKGSTPTRCVLPIGLGLTKTRSVLGANGEIRLQVACLRKASVIGDNWLP